MVCDDNDYSINNFFVILLSSADAIIIQWKHWKNSIMILHIIIQNEKKTKKNPQPENEST